MMDEYYDSEIRLRFITACERARLCLGESRGIGTFNEKILHASCKLFVDEDRSNHEIKINSYIADVKNEHGIFEVQTKAFNNLRNKLNEFLPTETVTLVYPVPVKKRLIKMDEKTGELSSPRVSPKHGGVFDIFKELYKLGDIVNHPGLRLLLLLVNVDEYRLVGGKVGRKGYVRFDRIPVDFVKAVYLPRLSFLSDFLPDTLPDSFTSKELAQCTGVSLSVAQTALLVMKRCGGVTFVGKNGRLNLYSRSSEKLK